MGELSIEEVINVLKPMCDSFFKEPSPEKARRIAELISRTSDVIVKNIDILYALTYHLKNGTFSKDQNIPLIEAIRAVLCKIRLNDFKLFLEIYRLLRMQIHESNQSIKLIEAHEELKEIVVLCMTDLFKYCSTNIIESFYVRQNACTISHGIYLCIAIARVERSISLRLAAINAVMTLTQVHEEADLQDVVLRDQIADVIMLFLPGLIKGLLEVALGSDTQNHKIIVMAIRAWSQILTLVMQDLPQEEPSSSSLKVEDIIKTKDFNKFDELKNILENTKRTPEWFTSASEQFKNIFTQLDVLTEHTNFKVRRELAKGVSFILLNCSNNMKPCFKIFLELLIILSEDQNIEVANESRTALHKIQDKCFQNKEMKQIVEILEDNLYDLLTKMPRIIRTSGETLQLVWLNRLIGYLKILGKQRLSKILLSSAHLQKLLLSLVNMVELDCTNVSLLENTTAINFEEVIYYKNSHSWKQFKFLFDSTTIKKIYNILKCLGEFGDRKTLVDSILQMILNMPKFRKELILILNAILEVPTDSNIQMPICKQVIELYITPDFWKVPTKVSDDVNFQTAQNNIVLLCLLLEGFGIMATVLQKDYDCFLLKTLYLIIEKAGSEHSLLRSIGLQTLQTIAKSQKQETVGELFQFNVDYISYHVTMKLRRVERNPGVLDVVNVVTNYSTVDFLPHLKSIVDDLLIQSGANIQKRNTQSFLKVFYAFVKCVKKLMSIQDLRENEEYFEKLKNLRASEIVINNFLEFYNAKKNANAYENDEKSENDIDENFIKNIKSSNNDFNEFSDYEEEKEKEIPNSINIVKDIMKRCLHFLPSQDFTESSLAMSTLKEGAFILKDYENELLPIVHEIWHPLVDRFQNPNPLVINHAWQLLCCLAQVSRDFIRSRTLKQILPALSNFLKMSVKESFKKELGSTYEFTQIFKLQKEILSQLGSLVKSLKLLERDTWNILTTTESYFDCLQNPRLQECSVNMYKEISDYNIDMVLIKCMDIWNQHVELVIPQNDLSNWYSKVTDCKVKSNYVQNVQKVLAYINEKSMTL